MLKHGEYSLRAIEQDDLEWIKTLRTDPSTQQYLGKFTFLNNRQQQSWWESVSSNDNQLYLVFNFKDTPIGIIRLTDIDWKNRSVCVGGDLKPDYRGQGHGTEMFIMIFDLCFKKWNLHRVWLLVMENNEVAINLYKKMGFKEEGKYREAIFRNGKYYDYILMGKLEAEQTL
jgi:UDP-4-amino-4,6-dideoxy-N-acetyl-beta-L-altrosamine N-acetyltransferase